MPKEKIMESLEQFLKEAKQMEENKRLDKIEIIEGWKIGAQFLSRQGELWTIFKLNIDKNSFLAVNPDGIFVEFNYEGDSIGPLDAEYQQLVQITSSIDRRRS